jgi:hypothetical protein
VQFSIFGQIRMSSVHFYTSCTMTKSISAPTWLMAQTLRVTSLPIWAKDGKFTLDFADIRCGK